MVLDYGHNPDGYRRIGEWLRQIPHRQLIGVIGVPGDRPNPLIQESARVAADIFQRIVVKEDEDKRGRKPKEVADILREEIQRVAPDKPVQAVLKETDALRQVLTATGEADIVVVFYESLEPLRAILKELQGVPVNQVTPAPRQPAVATR